jgi:drug/metabolite transporter (DMT)-like permease
MSLLALALLILAAVLHTGWNLLVKSATQKQIFTWLALCTGASAALPLLLTAPWLVSTFSAQVWVLVIASGLAEAVYYIMLVRAYSLADFSLVYPLARGTAPLFLALWNTLFLNEPPRGGGLVGLGLIVAGLLSISAQTLVQLKLKLRPRRKPGSGWRESGVGLALGVALCISIYSVIDGAAVRMSAAAPYIVMVFALTALVLAPFVLVTYRVKGIVEEWQANWWRILIVGAMTIITYLLVLQAYALSNVSYAGAIREISIVLAAFVGWKWLGEGFGKLRLAGALAIFAGIVVIAALG